MRILVSGVCGFVGSQLCKFLKELHPDIIIFGIDNLSRKGSWNNLDSLNWAHMVAYVPNLPY